MNAKTKEQLKDEIVELQKEVVRLEVSIEHNQKHVEHLEKINSDQHEQIMRLQDALVAREAPDAWADRKEDENGAELSEEERAEIKRNKGKQFAPSVVDAFLKIYPAISKNKQLKSKNR